MGEKGKKGEMVEEIEKMTGIQRGEEYKSNVTWVWRVPVVVEYRMQEVAEVTKLWVTNSPAQSQNILTACVQGWEECELKRVT